MNIIPQPYKFMPIAGKFYLTSSSKIFYADALKTDAKRFAELIFLSAGIKLSEANDISEAQISFSLPEEGVLSKDGYIIKCSGDLLTVEAEAGASCFYAVETLRQMFCLDGNPKTLFCDNCFIKDKPRFAYRGQHFDVARHFFGAEEVKNILDLMSRVKLNKFHFHLTDDQGFRIQIDKYPELNKISSVRDGSEIRSDGKTFVDEVRCEGYFSKAEIKDIVEYAAERHIEVIPEMDLPGHFVAALAAYPEYSCVGSGIEVRKKWGISKDLLCAGNERTYKFVCDILDEITALFPSEYIHLGGDEAPKDRWCNCKKCKAKLAELGLKDFEELQVYMFNYFCEYLRKKGRKVIGWNDGVKDSTDKHVISQLWIPMSKRSGVKAVNAGRDTVMSPFFTMYFDYPYAMTPLKKTYRFKPYFHGIKSSNRKHVLGVEGCLWTEFIEDTEKLYFSLLPRMLALSESAWGANNNYRDFKRRVIRYTEFYKSKGLNFNADALKARNVFYRIGMVRKFFKKDGNAELKYYNIKRQAKKVKKLEGNEQ